MRTSVNARRAPAAALGVALALTAAGAVAAPASAVGVRAVLPAAAPLLAASNVPATSPACSTATGATTCDLWAKPGTLTLPAGANPATVPIWGYSATDTGPASAPGPVLVATQGDTVTVTLHNGLAEASSLSFPQVDGFVDDGAGAAVGSTKTYTFTASRPGTYLYQAGLTADGPRQAAMGMVGALVVRPTVAGTLDGETATAFDDEALLVLTEVDNRLNANPASFDMRTFAPRFRLINGGALSSTTGTGATIGATPGGKLLLRTVNAGLAEHALGGLGLRQDVVALGGHSLAQPYNVFAETAQPGQTLDTLVTVPAGASGATVPLYETSAGDGISGNLANFSGMLAFITVGGTATTGGPAVTGLAVTGTHVPALPGVPGLPVKSGDTITVTGTAGTGATTVEYVIDDQTGTWTPISGAGAGAFSTAAVTVPVLSTGQHTVFVRATDDTTYGATSAVTFAVDIDGPAVTGLSVTPSVSAGATAIGISATGDDSAKGGSNTVSASYSLDGGTPVPLALNRTNNPVAALTGSIAAPGAAGSHTVAVTALDALGNATAAPATATYAVDTTGPVTDGTSISVSPAANDGTMESRVGSGTFSVSASITDDNAVGYGEGFFDTAGAEGTGFAMLANSNATGSPLTVKVDVPLSELTALSEGPHPIWVRGRDTAGNWGAAVQSAADALVVDKVAPVIGAVSLAPNPTRGAATGTVSFPVTNVGSAVGSGTWALTTSGGAAAGSGTLTGSAPGTGVAGTFTGTVTYPSTAGTYTLTVRVTDGTGRVTSKTASVTVQPNRIFANGFDSNQQPFGWSSRTGGGGGFTTSTNPSGGVIAGTRSGTVSLTSSGNYLTDNLPVAETTFHAQFLMRAVGTTGTTTTAAVYQAYTADNGGGTALFRVVLRHNGGGVQVGLATPTGTPTTWATVTTTTGASTAVRVDLVGTAATLTVNGVAVAGTVTTGSGAGVGSVRLGAVTGGGSLGSAVFDSYDSARDHLPS
jgi:FtsP/CotA-like multicopper oxidase with cupredoxin domain